MAFNHPHGSHYYQNVISWLVWSNDSYIQRLCVLSNCKMMSKLHLDKKLGEFLAGCVDWPKAVDRFPEWRFALTTGRSSVWRLKQTAFQTHQKIQFLLLSSRNSFFSTHICSFVESCNLEPKKKKKKEKENLIQVQTVVKVPSALSFFWPIVRDSLQHFGSPTVYSQYCFQQPQAAVFIGKATLPTPNDRLTTLQTTWWMQWNIWQLKSWICPSRVTANWHDSKPMLMLQHICWMCKQATVF